MLLLNSLYCDYFARKPPAPLRPPAVRKTSAMGRPTLVGNLLHALFRHPEQFAAVRADA